MVRVAGFEQGHKVTILVTLCMGDLVCNGGRRGDVCLFRVYSSAIQVYQRAL